MKLNSTEEIFARNIALLSEFTPEEERMVPTGTGAFPSIDSLREVISLVKSIIFPDFFNGTGHNIIFLFPSRYDLVNDRLIMII